MKICLGKELVEEIKKKNSENEKNLLKNRNSDELNEVDADDIYFHSNTIKNIKLGPQLVNRIYLNHSIVYDLEDTIDLNLFHSLVHNTATEIKFLYASNNPDLTGYNKLGYCDNLNKIEVWNNGTKYIIINPRKNYIYAPVSCSSFFKDYTALTTCILDNFDTRNTTSMSNMFYVCSSLASLDLSSFNTQSVTNMNSMFSECSSLVNLDLSGFNTQNVTNISAMFYNCNNLASLDVSNFKTNNITNMSYAFANCSRIKKIDLSSFNTLNVKTMSYMFPNCSRLTTIVSNTFDIISLNNSNGMFQNCAYLVGGNGTTYNSSHITAEYARVDGENGLPGYFTAPAANKK